MPQNVPNVKYIINYVTTNELLTRLGYYLINCNKFIELQNGAKVINNYMV